MEWLVRMTFTVTILIRIDGEKSRQMTCLLHREIDIFRLFIQDRSSFLGAMMDSIESMISLNTTSTIILGKKFLHPMTMRCLQVHAILTQLLFLKTQCTSLEVMMATTRMIFTDLTLLQIPGLKSRTQLESLLHLDIELHALLSKKTCICLVDMMGQNSLMTFTITVSKQANGFKYTLKDNKILPHETVTSY